MQFKWWHSENKSVAGLLDTQCPLCQVTTCSQAHILCVCLVLEHFREDHLRYLATANSRLPQGPQRQLRVNTLIWWPRGHRFTNECSSGQGCQLSTSGQCLTLIHADFLLPAAGLSSQVRAKAQCDSHGLTGKPFARWCRRRWPRSHLAASKLHQVLK